MRLPAYPPYCGSGALAAINPGATVHRPGGGPPTTAIPTAGRINRPPGRCIRRVWTCRGLVDAPAAYPPYCGSGALAAINPGATIHPRGRASYNRHPHRRPDKPAAGPVHPAGLVDAPAAYPPYCGSGALAAINPGATIHRPGGGPPTTAIPTAGRINRPPGRCIRRVWWMRLPAFPPDNASTLRLRR